LLEQSKVMRMLHEKEEEVRKRINNEWNSRMQKSEDEFNKIIMSLSIALDNSESRVQEQRKELENSKEHVKTLEMEVMTLRSHQEEQQKRI